MRSTAEIIISFRGSSLNRLVRQHFFESRADVLIAIKGDLLLERFGGKWKGVGKTTALLPASFRYFPPAIASGN
jgi:hypothetical protein